MPRRLQSAMMVRASRKGCASIWLLTSGSSACAFGFVEQRPGKIGDADVFRVSLAPGLAKPRNVIRRTQVRTSASGSATDRHREDRASPDCPPPRLRKRRPQIAMPDLGREENVVACNSGFPDAFAHLCLVAVEGCGIDVTIAHANRVADCAHAHVALQPHGGEPDDGMRAPSASTNRMVARTIRPSCRNRPAIARR